ncbi:MAG: 1-(5-phosphoribosyl)-5-[(5-phosphoribosylamino)methylideneamino]imidazole-4-carboxamide isomerase [Anaerolineae bacterium]
MKIYPSIDIHNGKVVRLREGDLNRQIIFDDNPVDAAKKWIEQGATWLHVVNLDGAFAHTNDNGRILGDIVQLGANIQFAGGLRDSAAIASVLEQGVTRVILGTVAIQDPKVVFEAVKKWGAERVGIALDSRDGKYVATHGWQQNSAVPTIELGRTMAENGVRHALFTDVKRDGIFHGVNISATADLARNTGLNVIASGGVASLLDIEKARETGVIAGVVIGMALYAGRINLTEAIKVAEDKDVN